MSVRAGHCPICAQLVELTHSEGLGEWVVGPHPPEGPECPGTFLLPGDPPPIADTTISDDTDDLLSFFAPT